ncbi:hypothetical protein SLS59_002545 [Nothophoma quercina]|uniref:Uncharacterized protein n=1 Tax=Nothophoma quercina TaxID=749835 RepID=A0ABR3RT06_9PLEO
MSKITKPTTAKPSSPHPKLYLKLRCIQAGLRDWELEQAAKKAAAEKAATDETALQASKERTEPKLYLKLRCIQAGLRDWEEAQAANVAALEELDVSKLRTASKVVAEKASTISKKGIQGRCQKGLDYLTAPGY